MQQLNNLDVIILIIVGISALIALSRGLVKEVLSIIGWVLVTSAIVYMLPILTPIASLYIKSGLMAGIVTSIFILISFLICWILLTGKIVGKVRSSKLSNVDRILGLFFGVVRAALLVILFNILINWMIPKENQADVLTKSKYFNIAGEFAKPIEGLIPQNTLDIIKDRAKQSQSVEQEQKETTELFEKLAQPQIKKATKDVIEKVGENFGGYKETERDNLDRLIENSL